MRLVEYFQRRLGMFVPTDRDGRLEAWVWGNLLHELVADGVASFRRGEATRLALDGIEGGGVAIGHDGRLCTGGLENVLEPPDSGCTTEVYGWFGSSRYALAAALAERLAIAVCDGGGGRTLECRRGKPGRLQQMLPGLGGPKGVWLAFVPNPDWLPDGKTDVEAFSGDALQQLGEALACGNPGLRVEVNGREHFQPRGVEELVAAQLEASGEEVLVPASAVAVPGAAFAWGAVRWRGEGRTLAGRAFLNGREVPREMALGHIGSMVFDGLCEGGLVPEAPCRVFFAFSAEIPGKLFDSPDFAHRMWGFGPGTPGDWNDQEIQKHAVGARCCALATQCLSLAFRKDGA